MIHNDGFGHTPGTRVSVRAGTGKIRRAALAWVLGGAVSAALALAAMPQSAGAADEPPPPSTQPAAGGGGSSGTGDPLPNLGYGGGGGGGSGGGGGVADPEAAAALSSGGGGGGGGGGGSGLSDTSASFDTAAAVSSVPLPAAIWGGMAAASGIGVYLKARKRK